MKNMRGDYSDERTFEPATEKERIFQENVISAVSPKGFRRVSKNYISKYFAAYSE